MSGELCSGILYGYISLTKSRDVMNRQGVFKKNGLAPNLTGRNASFGELLQIGGRRGSTKINSQRHWCVLALEQQNLLPLLRIRRANFFNPPGWRIEAHLRHFAQLFEQHIAFAQKPAQDCIDKAGKTLRALISANGVY